MKSFKQTICFCSESSTADASYYSLSKQNVFKHIKITMEANSSESTQRTAVIKNNDIIVATLNTSDNRILNLDIDENSEISITHGTNIGNRIIFEIELS